MDVNYYMEMQLELLADIKAEVQTLRNETIRLTETLAGIRAEAAAPATAAIAKAQETAKAAPATPADAAPAVAAEEVDAATLVKVAAEKSKTAGAEAVKGVIAGFAPKIKDVPADKLAALKDALEALA